MNGYQCDECHSFNSGKVNFSAMFHGSEEQFCSQDCLLKWAAAKSAERAEQEERWAAQRAQRESERKARLEAELREFDGAPSV